VTSVPVTLRELVVGDSQAVHAFSGLPEACRYQAWGPDTEEQAREFVRNAVDARLRSPRMRFAYAAWEGRLRHTLLIRDGWRDSEVSSILDEEWRPGTG
jgi:hypothetical protein